MIEKMLEKFEELRMRYFLTIANSGDEKLDFTYWYIGKAIDHCKEIVQEVAKEYGKDTNVPSNADRIRSFSDEELAENVSCPYIATECIHLDDDIECEQCKLQWLKSEAKE